MGAYNSKEEPSMEEPAAKRRRLELPLNAEQIIQNQQKAIESLEEVLKSEYASSSSLRAEIASKNKRIRELEDQVKQKNYLELLPNECLLKIMSYLSNYDVLRNMAQVSQRFHKLSQDPGQYKF